MYLGDTSTTLAPAPAPAGSNGSNYPILNFIAQLAPQIGNAIGQIKLIDLNSELIKQGKPTLTAAQAQALSPQINVGIAPETQTALLYLGAGVGALFLFSMLAKGARAR